MNPEVSASSRERLYDVVIHVVVNSVTVQLLQDLAFK